MTLGKKAFEKLVRKRENAGKQHFLLVPQCLLSETNSIILLLCILSSLNAFNLNKSKNLLYGSELNALLSDYTNQGWID